MKDSLEALDARYWKGVTRLMYKTFVKSDPHLKESTCDCCANKRLVLQALEDLCVPQELGEQ